MNEMKFWAFEDRSSHPPGVTRLERILADWFRGWEKIVEDWKAPGEKQRRKRWNKGFKNPI